VPEWLATITARLLEKDRAHRYPTAEAVLADICSRSAARPAGNPVARRRFPIAATLAAILVAAMALGAVTWRFSPSTAETVPTPFLCTADVKGGMLRGLDEDGRVLWRRDLGTPLDERAFTADALTRNPKLLVTDIDGDGSWEALLTASVEAGGLPMLLAFNSDGSERFRKQAGRAVKYGDEEYEGFNASSIYSLIDHQGKRRLFLLGTHRQWFPSVLEELDSQGRILAEYFASGAHTSPATRSGAGHPRARGLSQRDSRRKHDAARSRGHHGTGSWSGSEVRVQHVPPAGSPGDRRCSSIGRSGRRGRDRSGG